MYYLNYYYDERTHKTFYKVVKNDLSYNDKWSILETYVYNDKNKIYQSNQSYSKYCKKFVIKKRDSKFKKFLKFIIDL